MVHCKFYSDSLTREVKMKRLALLTAFTYILFISMSEASDDDKIVDQPPSSTPRKISSSPTFSSDKLSSEPVSPKTRYYESRDKGYWSPSGQRMVKLLEIDRTKDYLTEHQARTRKRDKVVKDLTNQIKT